MASWTIVTRTIVLACASAAADHYIVDPYIRPRFPELPFGKKGIKNEESNVTLDVTDPILEKAEELGFLITE